MDEDDFDSGTGSLWQRDRVLQEWPAAMEFAQTQLLTSKTKTRVEFLENELLSLVKHADLSLSQTMDVFKLLTETYPRYIDQPSREAVEKVGMEIIRRDEIRGTPDGPADETKMGVAEQVLGWMGNEVGKISKRGSSQSSADIFVLLSWSASIYAVCLTENDMFAASRSYKTLVGIIALLLNSLLDDSLRIKASMQRSALVRTRRALRSAPDQLLALIDTLTKQVKADQAPLKWIPLLGVSIDVLLHWKIKPLPVLSDNAKNEIFSIYVDTLILSKTPVPSHVSASLNGFISEFASEQILEGTILPAVEKSTLRSPETALHVVNEFFKSYRHPLSNSIIRKVIAIILTTSKSTNSAIRENTTELFKTIASTPSASSEFNVIASDLLSLPKSGKTTGPDHRVTLFSMLAVLAPGAQVSETIVQTTVPLLAKETHEGAIKVMSSVIPAHAAFLLREGRPLPKDTITVMAKELASLKPPTRRAFFTMVGETFWLSNGAQTEAYLTLAKAVTPAMDSHLKTLSAGSNTSTAIPFEAYIATAVLLGPLSRLGAFADIFAKNQVIQSFATASAKAGFLLSEKIYQRITDSSEELWLLRASEAVLFFVEADVSKNQQLRTQLGLIFVQLGVHGSAAETRRATSSVLSSSASKNPLLVNRLIKDALEAYIARKSTSSPASEDATLDIQTESSRLNTLLLSAFTSHEQTDPSTQESLLVDSVILSHHPLICGKGRQTWVEACQKARIDPKKVVDGHIERLLQLLLESSSSSVFSQASYTTVTTLSFVSPDVGLPRILDQIKKDLEPEPINSLTDFDLDVWAAPAGVPFVDVLSQKKADTVEKKGKNADINKWEADVRKSLAEKKANATKSLSKQDQALVQAQLEKEDAIRAQVSLVQANLRRGLHFIQSLVDSRIEDVRSYVPGLSSLLIRGALQKGHLLVGSYPFEIYLELSNCSSDRLDTFRRWIGVASLRSLDIASVPEDYTAEPLNHLVIRVLYRLRTLSEQTPFDGPTFSYAFPLLSQIIIKGGLSAAEEDEALEQLTLALNVVDFHVGSFEDPTFPRIDAVRNLLYLIRQQPRLSKDASTTLVSLGEAIHNNATREEINILLEGTLHQEVYARNSCLQTLQPFDLTDLDWSPELWIATHDEDEQNSRLAQHIWEDNGLDVPENYLDRLLSRLGHQNAYVRESSAAAIAGANEHWPQSFSKTLKALEDWYRDKAQILAPEFDQYGMVIAQSLDRADPWPARLSTAQTFKLLAPAFVDTEIDGFFNFLIKDEALGDRHADVRRAMLDAGNAVIDLHGAKRLASLIGIFEEHLAKTEPHTETSDYIKEAVVILFGRVARHLNGNDTRIPSIVNRLVEALKTPSEQVQIAVSDCLAPLMAFMPLKVGELIDQLMDEISNAPKYAARRGAAYGLAGVIKGTGITGIKQYDLIARLRAFSEDKKQYEPRQGCMFAFETLSATLGRLFEPYVIHILPVLLVSFGDGTSDVREATQDAARVIMGNLSGYGVKLILPDLLSGLEEKQWRTKKGSIELLGMMAYCSPRQLSLSLPIVIPQLTGVLTDSHAQVRAAANKSLKQFGEVISNPEIQNIVPVLLKALVDPEKTSSALSSLLKTSFMHYIDHSSLALVIPIIERGLRGRGADIKRKAAQIVGNLASITDSKDFVPYLGTLLPMVHVVLVDPVPEARATAAKSLGTLVERLGEGHFPDLVPGLLRTLKTDTSGVDRQGAAQGLSEVLSGLGMERLEGLLPDIIANAQSPRSTVREGFMSLLVFLPATFGTRFQPHLPKIIAPILSGLSDTEEYVREAAMRAGRMMVTNYSSKAIDLLLPELENGMFDSGWRIRQASITLVGELLFKVSGISGKTEINEDEEVAEASTTDSSRRVLVEVLGAERRDRILASLYIIRQDAVAVVRQTSIHIWKALVHNTPRTVRELLPELISQIVSLMSGGEFDQRETAGRTMAELCRKLGERILGEMVPVLRTKSSSPDSRTREGVCLALCEIMVNASESQREDHEDDIIAMVRTSLVDDEQNVRSAAAQAFDMLQEHVGAKAIDQTIPTLLEALRQPGASSGSALDALREVMAVRANTVFPILIPTLTAMPMSVFNARALASLTSVAGSALNKRLAVILNALVKVTEDSEGPELQEAAKEALHALFETVDDLEGLNNLMMILLEWVKHESPVRRASACNFFAMFCEISEADSSLYRVDWIRQLVSLLEDGVAVVHTAAWNALDVFVKTIPKDELEPLVVPLRRTIENTAGPGQNVPGFSLPKGVSPLVPIIIAGLTTGSNEQREQAAYAIGDIVERTEESAIKPFVVPFTGPLIRVATQATTYPPAVKTAILSALLSMLDRIPIFVKPFFPQLQRTFVKSASDPASNVVRTKAAEALGALMKNQPRVDPVITELITGAKANEDSISASLILSIANVVRSGGSNVGAKAIESCAELVSDALRDGHSESYGQSIALLFSALAPYEDLLRPITQNFLAGGTPLSVQCSQIIVTTLEVARDEHEESVFEKMGLLRGVALKVKESAASDKPSIARPAREARDILKALDSSELAGLF